MQFQWADVRRVAAGAALVAIVHSGLAAWAAPLAASSLVKTPRVSGKLVVGAAGVVPGAEFPVGVLIDIEKGWHIYWVNPGDSGLATSVQFFAPEGFTVGPVRWPTPEDFEQPGGLHGFGYRDSVMLSALVRAPSNLSGRARATLHADVRWLACASICVPGRTTVEETIPVGRQFKPAHASLFARWDERLPSDPGAPELPFTVRTTRGPAARIEVALAWKRVPPPKVEWFPGASEAVEVEHESVTTEGRVTRIVFDARRRAGRQPEGEHMPGVVAWTDGDGRRHSAWLVAPYD